jgi:hypothetical protein
MRAWRRARRFFSLGSHSLKDKAIGQNKTAGQVKPSQPLLDAWPAGYERGSFRIVSGGVLLSAEGMPTLRIEDDGGIVPPKGSMARTRMERSNHPE